MHDGIRARRRPLKFALGGLLALAVVAAFSGCAGLAGMGVEGGVHETSVTPPPPDMAVQLRSWFDGQGKYHQEHVMEKLKDPSRPAHLQVLQATWRDQNGEEHKGTVAALVTDPPRQRDPGVPSGDAWVVVMWRYAGTYSDGCVHGAVVRTDAAGQFRAHGWIDPLNFGPEFYPWRRYQRLLVYKPGYAIADTGAEADIRIPADNKPFIMLHPLTGGLEARLAEVNELIDGPTLNCSNSSLISPPSPQMAPFLLAITDEAASLAKNKGEQDSVEAMRTRVKLRLRLAGVQAPTIQPVAVPVMVAPALAPAPRAVMAPVSGVMAPAAAAPVRQAQ